ncbi:MAG: hypothetical protein J7L34_00685 [Thermotogaceae bacterium]|nr:hypothetical protein [Thermotogaceae bacterium]
MEIVRELENYLDKLVNDYQSLKEENEKLWQELEDAQAKIEKLEEEKSRLEELLEEQQKSLNRMVERLQNLLSSTSELPADQEMMWGGNQADG